MRTYMLLLAALIAVGAGATLLGGRETYVPGDCEMASVVGGSGTWFPCASCQPHQRCTGTQKTCDSNTRSCAGKPEGHWCLGARYYYDISGCVVVPGASTECRDNGGDSIYDLVACQDFYESCKCGREKPGDPIKCLPEVVALYDEWRCQEREPES